MKIYLTRFKYLWIFFPKACGQSKTKYYFWFNKTRILSGEKNCKTSSVHICLAIPSGYPKQEQIRFFPASVARHVYTVDDLSTIWLLESQIRKHLHWFDNGPTGVQRITAVHKQKSRHAGKVFPAEFINIRLPHETMIKPLSAPKLSDPWGNMRHCVLHLADICTNYPPCWSTLPSKFTVIPLMLHGDFFLLLVTLSLAVS